MGGRGMMSPASMADKSKRLIDATTASEVGEYLTNNYGIQVDNSFNQLDVDVARNAAEGIEETINLFGDITSLGTLKAEVLSPNVLGAARTRFNQQGELVADLKMALNVKDLGNFSMDGAKGTAAHELGHILINKIINSEYSSPSERAKAYNKHSVETSIVNKAYRNLKKNGQATGSIEQARKSISLYAGHYKGGKGNSEALSEAIDDVIINKSKANPFSQEIVKEIKSRLGR